MASVLNLLYIVWVAIVFLTMISILVAAHELGHYLFARMFGMGVEEFAIGFGKRPLVTYMRRFYRIPLLRGLESGVEKPASPGLSSESSSLSLTLEGKSQEDRIEQVEVDGQTFLQERTDFTIRPWPLGGFVRIKGMMPEEDGSETRIAGGFYNKPPWQRILVLFAGPLFSVLAGIAILVPLFMVHGIKEPTDKAILGRIMQDDPAMKAGLKENDRIVSVNGTRIETFYEMSRIVRDRGGMPTEFVINRDGQALTLSVTPLLGDKPTPVMGKDGKPTGEKRIQARIGAYAGAIVTRLPFTEALNQAVMMPVNAAGGLARIFSRPSEIKENVGGPGTMIKATNDAVKMGVPYVLYLAAVLSISVGIFNLLPAPPLDGGQIAIAFAEMFRGGRRLSMRVQVAVGTVGTLFVFGLILTALAVDFQRIALDPQKKPAVEKSR